MRTCFACRAAHFLAQKATEATGITAKALLSIVTAVLTALCLFCPFATHADDTAQCSPELKSNPLLVLANIVKRIEPPPFRIISLLSGGRVNVVMPPKLIINKLMDGLIVLAANK